MTGNELLKIREKLGYTQKEFAEIIGVDRRTIINYEQGRKIPNTKIILLNTFLNQGFPDLKGDKEESINWKTNILDLELRNLNREVIDLKDHIKTLKESLESKSKLANIYESEITLLKKRLVYFENKESDENRVWDEK
jgi:DNA-binding XRE family transcriptional regulator